MRNHLIIPRPKVLKKAFADKTSILGEAAVNGVDHFNVLGVLQEIAESCKDGITNASPILPSIFNLNREAYSLADHFVFEPYFNLLVPQRITWMCGRQVGKSLSSMARSILMAWTINGYKILHVCPLQSQSQRLSNLYAKPFIEFSTLKSIFVNANCAQRIEQREFSNGSVLHFSYAFRDCSRIRGYAVHSVMYDEAATFDPSFQSIIDQTTKGQKAEMRCILKLGTPTSKSNNLERSFREGSQAEFVIRCPHCGHWNIPNFENDLEKMLGPRNPKYTISKDRPGIVCAGLTADKKMCGKSISPRDGIWIHAYPDRRFTSPSYHIPQIVLPLHCESDVGWRQLQAYRMGADNTTPDKFYNEICGISYDEGARLISIDDIKSAANLPVVQNHFQDAIEYVKQKTRNGEYAAIALGVDIGGGGQKDTSFTVTAVCCLRYDNTIEIPFAYRSLNPFDQTRECKQIEAFRIQFGANAICIDYAGPGQSRPALLEAIGTPPNMIHLFEYHRLGSGSLMKRMPYDKHSGARPRFSLDKSRGLSYICNYIKAKQIRFFQWNDLLDDKQNLLYEFLNLVEDRYSTPNGQDIFTIVKDDKAGITDDFCTAVSYACCYLWGFVSKEFPSFGSVYESNIKELTQEMIAELEGNDEDIMEELNGN